MLHNLVHIKSKDDLPKKDDLYVCLLKNGSVGKCTFKVDCPDSDKYMIDFFWLNNVEAYFNPISEPAQGMPTRLDAEKYSIEQYVLMFEEHQKIRMADFNHGFMNCFDWFKSRLAPSKDELRKELLRLVQIARKGSMIISKHSDNEYWKFDIDSENKVVDEYLKGIL